MVVQMGLRCGVDRDVWCCQVSLEDSKAVTALSICCLSTICDSWDLRFWLFSSSWGPVEVRTSIEMGIYIFSRACLGGKKPGLFTGHNEPMGWVLFDLKRLKNASIFTRIPRLNIWSCKVRVRIQSSSKAGILAWAFRLITGNYGQ